MHHFERGEFELRDKASPKASGGGDGEEIHPKGKMESLAIKELTEGCRTSIVIKSRKERKLLFRPDKYTGQKSRMREDSRLNVNKEKIRRTGSSLSLARGS